MARPLRFPRPSVLDRIPIGRHTVIEASAGTGKTYTLEHLVLELLLRGGATIDQILVVTFTEKATREMRQRVRRKLDEIVHARTETPAEADGFWEIDEQALVRVRDALARFDRTPISTIHGFCQRVLTEHAFDSQGLFEQEQVDPRVSFGRAFRDELREALGGEDELRAPLERLLAEQSADAVEASLYDWYCEHGRPRPDPEPWSDEEGTPEQAFVLLVHRLLPRVRRRLDAFKRRRGQMDFDDMLLRLRDALWTEDGAQLVADLRSAYRYALVDEFQDTDEVQWAIFRRLFFEGPRNVLFVIGDPKQAIYGFRNADVHTYLRARREIMRATDSFPVHLEDNYRSTARVIAGYNRILSDEYFQGEIDYRPVRCGRPDLAATDGAGRELGGVHVAHVVGRGRKPSAGEIRATFYDFIAREIERVVSLPLHVGTREDSRPIVHSDIHVLTRTGTEAAEVGRVLRRYGVPYAFFREEGLFQTEQARHVRDVLRAIENPADRSLRLHAWMTPFFALRLEDLTACRELPETHPLVARLYGWKELADAHRYEELTRALIEQSGLVRRELFLREGERELTNYLHILEFLLEQAHARRRGLPELRSQLEAYIARRADPPGENGNIQRLESERHAVQILTMHKAKGLEAPVVFVAGGFYNPRPGRFSPRVFHVDGQRHAWIGSTPKEMRERVRAENREEDERLLYVALTRASARLYLPYLGDPPPGRGEEGDEYRARSLSGTYRVVNERLRTLIPAGLVDEAPDVFAYHRLPVRHAEASDEPEPEPAGPRAWSIAPELLAPRQEERGLAFARLRRERGGLILTSYTRMKAGRTEGRAVAEGGEGEEFTAEAQDVPALADSPDGLPGGAGVGVFLHEVLEQLPFETVRDAAGVAEWSRMDSIRGLFVSAARRNGIAPSFVSAAQRLVFAALRAPMKAGPLVLPQGLCSVERRVAEMRFHFPLPETPHPALDRPRPPAAQWPFTVGRGFVRGVVDLVFEHEGRVYFLDYKSDRLADWSADAIEAHVQQRYDLQARLYALGVIRMLDLRDEEAYGRRFGGLLYLFLRGMTDGDGRGVHFERPPWRALLAWERELRDRDAPWGYALSRPGAWAQPRGSG